VLAGRADGDQRNAQSSEDTGKGWSDQKRRLRHGVLTAIRGNGQQQVRQYDRRRRSLSGNGVRRAVLFAGIAARRPQILLSWPDARRHEQTGDLRGPLEWERVIPVYLVTRQPAVLLDGQRAASGQDKPGGGEPGP